MKFVELTLKLNGRMRENEISWGMILNGFQSQVPIKYGDILLRNQEIIFSVVFREKNMRSVNEKGREMSLVR